MKQSTAKAVETANGSTALSGVGGALSGQAEAFVAYVGLDVHKETVAVAIAECGRGQVESCGEIANTPVKVARLIERLSVRYGGERVLFVYEAGPCGYTLYHQVVASGHACEVVAPSLIPRKAGERIKTDRRDARALARLSRAGELTAVWVPDAEQEAMRDLTRARGHEGDRAQGAAAPGGIAAASRVAL